MFCPRCGKPVPDGATFCPSCGTPMPGAAVAVATPMAASAAPAMAAAPSLAAVKYGGFWRRFWAAVIDGILISIVTWPFRLGAGLSTLGVMLANRNGEFNAAALAAAIAAGVTAMMVKVVVSWLYFAIMESTVNQASLGKMVLGLKVTDMNGGRISFARATGRVLASFLSTLILCFGYIMIAFTEKKQGLHDMLTNTLVVRAKA
jgi:uncharacterized RDD family membrane protein YckC